ncbi:MAG: UDP-N-acetylmuramoyl-L-alanyl-D-glutamate--2,6-diaminopimelate ligase, partial [Myxococcales bacterium]|nr:UDP-N-acetylmuramoyl-L-alanyl-D-glutamate--2,6-diaminopimelate ligase [Myxococcales bacterium]
MKVAELARALGAVCVGDASVDVNGVHHDSRRVLPGELFAAIRGGTSDGRTFLPAVEGAGAGAVLADAPVTSKLPVLTVADTRRALGAASHLVYGNPSASLDCVGITGTNGKTT